MMISCRIVQNHIYGKERKPILRSLPYILGYWFVWMII